MYNELSRARDRACKPQAGVGRQARINDCGAVRYSAVHYAYNWLAGIGAGGERMLPTRAGSPSAGAERQASGNYAVDWASKPWTIMCIGCASSDGDRHMNYFRMAIALLAIVGVAARAQERLPTIPPAQYTEEQKQAAADFEAVRRVPVFGPFEPLMYSPQVMSQARAMGDYLRYKSAIGNSLSELVILITAHEWRQNYEWAVHYPIALKSGIVGYYTFLAMQLNVARYQVSMEGTKRSRIPR